MRGVQVEGREIYDARKREQWLKKLPPEPAELGRLMSEQLDGLVATVKRAQEWMQKEARRYPIVGLLATAPGIGDIRAA